MNENVKLIADFIKLKESNVKGLYDTADYLTRNPKSMLMCSVPFCDNFSFHKSKDSLTDVVNKIKRTIDKFDKNDTFLPFYFEEIIIEFSYLNVYSKPIEIYRLCINFIKEYNLWSSKQKKLKNKRLQK